MTASPLPSVRRSSAVLLTRGGGDGREVFLVQRSRRLAFFGGFWALPGGVLEPEDRIDVDEEGALRRCALRELEEETGVRAGPGGFEALEPLGRLTTPPFARRRYRTDFFHLELPPGEEAEARLGELTAGAFLRPRDVLDEWLRGERRVVPPLLALLELWTATGFDGLADRFRARCAAVEAGELVPSRVTPGIAMVSLRTPTVPPAVTTNTYLVGTRDVWIVDPATWEEDERARLFALLDRWRADGRRLAGVLVTHHHRDHVGSVAEVSRRYALEVRAHARTLDRLPPGFRRGAALEEGERIELGSAPDGTPGWTLTAHHTPGHDRGHVVFRESRYGAIVAGDLVSTLSTIVIDPPEGHLATYLASLERVRSLGARTLHPAHGPAHTEGDALLAGYLEHRARREAVLERARGPRPRGRDALAREVYAGEDPRLLPLAARSLLAGLEKLEEEGRAERDGAAWRAPRP